MQSGSSEKADGRRALLILGALIAAHLVFAVVFWGTTWDDSAITLAFSRTLAFNGVIAPTPLSGIVEGYSTTLWMLLNALLAPFVGSPGGTLATAKLLATGFNAAAIGLTYILARRYLETRFALLVAVLFGTLSIAWIEAVNGMETPLLVTLLLVAILTYKSENTKGSSLYIAATSLFILVRWEAAWYLMPFVLASLLRRGWRGLFRVEHVVWLAVLVGSSLWRHAYFGSWLPNTILAKSHPPYSPEYGLALSIVQHIKPLVIIALALAPLCLGLLVMLFRGSERGRRWDALRSWFRTTLSETHRLLLFLVVAGLVFNVVIGQNWGPKNRMFYIVFPPLLILLVSLAEHIYLARLDRQNVVWRILLLSVALNGLVGVVWASDAQRKERITIANIASVAEGAEAIRLATGSEHITYAAADMGALLLYYGEDLRVLDLALLNDSTLARNGYQAASAYIFEDEQPDIIETHWLWTPLIGFATVEAFFDDYVPVFSGGLRFFVRREKVNAIDPSRLTSGSFDENGDTDEYRRDHFIYDVQVYEDYELNRQFGDFLILDSGR